MAKGFNHILSIPLDKIRILEEQMLKLHVNKLMSGHSEVTAQCHCDKNIDNLSV